jgi:biotin carboxyl carrier protein
VKYVVEVDGRSFPIEVAGDVVRLDGQPVPAALTAVPQTPLRQLLLDGTARVFAMARGEGAWVVSSGGESWLASVTDERTERLRKLTASGVQARGTGTIRAPMPGLVVQVEVELGQRVEAGVGVVVLEAMKMENEIRASMEGTVAAIHVSAGQAVEKGAPLVELAAEG